MRQFLFVLFLLASLPAGVAASGPLLPAVIDQFHEDAEGFSTNRVGAQVFTVGQSGILDRIEVPLRHSGLRREPDGVTTVRIGLVRVIDGIPGTSRLALITSTIVSLPLLDATPYDSEIFSLTGFQWASLSDIGLHVNAGDQYSIAVGARQTPRNQTFDWCATFPNQLPYEYPSGEPWRIIDTSYTRATDIQDFCFRTYVRPIPEPATSVVGVVGVIGIVAVGCRKR